MEKGRLILIVGASGSGKSLLANEVIRKGVCLRDDKILPGNVSTYDEEYPRELSKITTDINNTTFYARKYLTREPRAEDVGIVHSTKEEMELKCDIIMPGYKEGDLIGFNIDEIVEQIDNGKYPVIVTGIMGAVQEIVKAFYERQRIDDIYLVGIHGLLMDMNKYVKLEKGRYQGSIMEDSAIESAKKRYDTSKLFARQYDKFRLMLDYEVINYRLKYARDPDLSSEAMTIWSLASNPNLSRDDEQKRCIMEFICCSLSEMKPVKDDEIRIIG